MHIFKRLIISMTKFIFLKRSSKLNNRKREKTVLMGKKNKTCKISKENLLLRVKFASTCIAQTMLDAATYDGNSFSPHTCPLLLRVFSGLLLILVLPAKEKGNHESVGESEWN